jgi:hypothetical protein
MFVLISDAGGAERARATVAEAENLKQLHAEFRGVSDDIAAGALREAGLGDVDGDHAWLETAALRAAGDGSAEWTAGFDAMLAYAASKGWSSEDGSRVRAHIVRSS